MNEADARRQHLVDALVRTGAEDRAAFRELYDLTSAKLFGICLRICGERQAAEDVLHEVYITIWRRAGAFEPGRSSPITWLGTIARNRAIDWRRANKEHLVASVDEALPLPDPAPLASDALVGDEDRQRLLDCLEGLDDRARDAVRTAFFDGLTYAELAARASAPLGTIKSMMRRSLARLRDCLDDGGARG